MWLLLLIPLFLIAILVGIFSKLDKEAEEKKIKCLHCDNETYLLKKDICTSCRKNLEGEEKPEEHILELTGRSPVLIEKKKKLNRSLIVIFSVLAVGALIITITKLVK